MSYVTEADAHGIRRRTPGLRVLGIATAGDLSADARRIAAIAHDQGWSLETIPVDRNHGRLRNFWRILRGLRSAKADMIWLEGTGVLGGMACLLYSFRDSAIPFLVSSGDAVGPFLKATNGRAVGTAGSIYERLLYRRAFGFVGWSPEFCGRALHMGASRAVTVRGFAQSDVGAAPLTSSDLVRAKFTIPPDSLMVLSSGSLRWVRRRGYCYGLELVEAAKWCARFDVAFVIAGDGSGLPFLRAKAAHDPRIIFTGRLDPKEFRDLIHTADVAVLPQTLDLVGGLRLTTKLPEYLACGLPVISSSTPALLNELAGIEPPAAWFMPAVDPNTPEHARALADIIDSLDRDRTAAAGVSAQRAARRFSVPNACAALGTALSAWGLGSEPEYTTRQSA